MRQFDRLAKCRVVFLVSIVLIAALACGFPGSRGATPSVSPTTIPYPGATPTLISTPTPSVAPPLPWAEPLLLSEEALAALVPEGAIARLGIGRVGGMYPSPDGSRVAMSGSVGIFLFALPEMDLLWTAPTDSPIRSLDWSPDSALIAAGLMQKGMAVFDATTGAEYFRYDAYTVPIYGNLIAIRFSPNGQYLATSGCVTINADSYCGKSVTHLWNTTTGDLLLTGEISGQLQWSPDSRFLNGSTSYGTVWDVTEKSIRSVPYIVNLDVSFPTVIFSPDWSMVAIGDSKNTFIQTWPEGEILYEYHSSPSFDATWSWSPDGSYLMLGQTEKGTIVLNVKTGEETILAADS